MNEASTMYDFLTNTSTWMWNSIMDTTPIVAWLEAELVTLHAFQHWLQHFAKILRIPLKSSQPMRAHTLCIYIYCRR